MRRPRHGVDRCNWHTNTSVVYLGGSTGRTCTKYLETNRRVGVPLVRLGGRDGKGGDANFLLPARPGVAGRGTGRVADDNTCTGMPQSQKVLNDRC